MTTPAPTTPAEPVTPPAATPAPPTPPAEPTAQQPAEPKGDGLPDDPVALKAEIAKLRRENASDRTTAKQKAADDARTELAQTIGKALGIVEDENVDPAKLTEALTARETEAKQARLELAIYQAAASAGADPSALLDSRTFMAKIAQVDPGDTAAVTAAIGEALTANPAFTAGQNRLPAPNPAQGSSASGPTTPAQLSDADVERLYAEKKYDEIDQARKDGRLSTILGAP